MITPTTATATSPTTRPCTRRSCRERVSRRGGLGHVRNLDVVPTIAALLGVELKDVEGRVLREALE